MPGAFMKLSKQTMQTSTPGILAQIPCPRKVVIIGQVRLGGFLCTTPALRALKQAIPRAEIVMITVDPLRDLILRSPYLDRFEPLPDLMLEQEERPLDARGFTRFLQAMQAEHFDLAIQLRGYGVRSSPYLPLFGARTNVGFLGPADMPLLDAAIPFPRQGHMIDRYLGFMTFLGAQPVGRHTEFPLASEDHAAAATLLSGAKRPLIGVHPTAREPERVWKPERFAAVAGELQRLYGGTVVVITKQRGDSAAELITGEIRGACFNLAGRTSLSVLGAVIKELSVLITNDTGPAHIAYALEVPTVTLFAAETKTPFWPPDLGPFRPLTSLATLTVEQVIQAAKEILFPA